MILASGLLFWSTLYN